MAMNLDAELFDREKSGTSNVQDDYRGNDSAGIESSEDDAPKQHLDVCFIGLNVPSTALANEILLEIHFFHSNNSFRSEFTSIMGICRSIIPGRSAQWRTNIFDLRNHHLMDWIHRHCRLSG